MGMAEIQMLAAFAKQHMNKSHSVCLSALDPSQWGHIRKMAGVCPEVQRTACAYGPATSQSACLDLRAKGHCPLENCVYRATAQAVHWGDQWPAIAASSTI